MAIFNSYFDITRGYIFIGKMMSIPWIWGFLPCPKPWSETEVQATAYPEGLRLLPGVCRAQSVVSCLEWVILDIFGVYLQCGAPPRYKLVYKHHDHEYYIYISSSPTFSYIGGPTFCHLWTWTTLVWRTHRLVNKNWTVVGRFLSRFRVLHVHFAKDHIKQTICFWFVCMLLWSPIWKGARIIMLKI
jgi:hypothetical protein